MIRQTHCCPVADREHNIQPCGSRDCRQAEAYRQGKAQNIIHQQNSRQLASDREPTQQNQGLQSDPGRVV